MKSKVLILMFSITLIIAIFSTQHITATPDAMQEVNDMVNLVNDKDFKLQKWEMMVKENVASEQLPSTIKNIEEVFEEATYKKEETDLSTKIVFNTHKKSGANEEFIVIIPTDKNHSAQLIYTLSGTKWNDVLQTYHSSKLEKLLNTVFTQKSTKFSCIYAESSGIIDSVYVIDNIIDKLQVQTLEKIDEEDFSVLSGYTPRWNSVIPISDKDMNVQIAARNGLGGKTTLTIGTPIIVTEY